MKISIVYHSSTGRTEAAAKEIVKGIEAVEGKEAVLIPVSSFSEKKDEYVKELQESAGVLFGTPDYYAAESWQLKQWLAESWAAPSPPPMFPRAARSWPSKAS